MIKTRPFIDHDFLLTTEASAILYHDYAKPLPVIDYHNHLSPKDIATNRQFANITEAWLEGDHYKWRAMRTNGVDEEYCTGNKPPSEKFHKWAETVPATLRNPLYHWTHLELKSYFSIDRLLDRDSADDIYEACNTQLGKSEYAVQGLLSKMNVEVLCTTDDPCDDLQFHKQLPERTLDFKMLPTFRPDKSYAFEDPESYNKYLDQLSAISGYEIRKLDDLLMVLEKRIEYFHSFGCRLADHGLEYLPFLISKELNCDRLFETIRAKKHLTPEQREALRTHILLHLSKMYCKKKWVQQFHLGAIRNNNTRMKARLGFDAGFDSIGDFAQARTMASYFDALDQTDELPQTIIYNLNPADNEVFATMIGNFQDGSVAGKIQWGSGWWFLDQKDGMEKQINALSNMGLLSRFVGMVTDSRSFLSFPRHEYFRRILCDLIGRDVTQGLLPDDLALAGKLVQDVCYHNAKNYFKF
jgi:glucuronate isomerase